MYLCFILGFVLQWVADGSPTHSTAVRIDHMLQFVPKGTDPKEFKKLQQQVSVFFHLHFRIIFKDGHCIILYFLNRLKKIDVQEEFLLVHNPRFLKV